jgi:hypothetical protein
MRDGGTVYVRAVRNIGRQEARPALSSVGVREAAMRRLASVRETSIGQHHRVVRAGRFIWMFCDPPDSAQVNNVE